MFLSPSLFGTVLVLLRFILAIKILVCEVETASRILVTMLDKNR